ncbi:MAG: Crp/Fnr family transcriptional regulator [Bacteroidetes bacterium]|jgi:CRP/FNR family transcriptional regulator|nr:Crp/Fnr family transcriptional regulator [Bacteroidota bacterium]MBS1778099.1 Crp/Fnr family transcriptional regulator [Bacteroidota bacterium]
MDELITIDEHKSCIPYKKGQIIFNEGNYPLGVYCINKGKVKLAHAGQDGKEQIVKLAKEGDVLGYRSMLSSERYNASAIALEDTQICFISKEVFFSLLRKNPTLSLEIIRMLALELRLTENRLTDIAQKPVRERMAEALLFLKETYGFEKDNATISVVLSREDIANLVGTATETAIRLLSEFKHDKIVVFVGKKIKILDMDKLVKTANIYN